MTGPQAIVFDRHAADQVLLDYRVRAPLRCTNGTRRPSGQTTAMGPACADLQTIGLGPLHAPCRATRPNSRSRRLRIIPRLLAHLAPSNRPASRTCAQRKIWRSIASPPICSEGALGLRQVPGVTSVMLEKIAGRIGTRNQPFLPAIRAISALTSRSTISGKIAFEPLRPASAAASRGSALRARFRPDLTIWGGRAGSADHRQCRERFAHRAAPCSSVISRSACGVVRPRGAGQLDRFTQLENFLLGFVKLAGVAQASAHPGVFAPAAARA